MKQLGRALLHARYGIDAPAVVGINIAVGSLFALFAAIGFALPEPKLVPFWVSIGAACIAGVPLLYAAVMLRSSLVGKKRVRDRLVAALALSGSERVLDAGCGLGLAPCGRPIRAGRIRPIRIR